MRMISHKHDKRLILLVIAYFSSTVCSPSMIANGLMHDISSTPNPLSPNLMSADERLAEVGAILAAGLRRILSQQSSSLSAAGGDSSFDILALKRRVGRRKPSNRVGG
ncbi:hypothetical protein KUG47_15205 [Falsochrobactrum sp. TDYN1]|uniref:Uncharacterized protein n=1 Tax=Falsochrobactrum tianjinense TaxID=2706015 RepID=A0A949PNX9_9HYPH|nr:hypothetical protein [Falsochrobactrum sp. TDYN1]MBV2144846.1 hypothetical protein [Falsochrobactrum sp. TDYN1]